MAQWHSACMAKATLWVIWFPVKTNKYKTTTTTPMQSVYVNYNIYTVVFRKFSRLVYHDTPI